MSLSEFYHFVFQMELRNSRGEKVVYEVNAVVFLTSHQRLLHHRRMGSSGQTCCFREWRNQIDDRVQVLKTISDLESDCT